jgi:hypothetical protein
MYSIHLRLLYGAAVLGARPQEVTATGFGMYGTTKSRWQHVIHPIQNPPVHQAPSCQPGPPELLLLPRSLVPLLLLLPTVVSGAVR